MSKTIPDRRRLVAVEFEQLGDKLTSGTAGWFWVIATYANGRTARTTTNDPASWRKRLAEHRGADHA